jgi:8-oxo-dGTP pyrophosphatase MutT (NUDIX family)
MSGRPGWPGDPPEPAANAPRPGEPPPEPAAKADPAGEPRPAEQHPVWEVLRSEVLIDSPFLRLRREHVRASTGYEIAEYFVVDAPDFAVILALTPDHQVILVRQYRHGLGRTMLELPAGVIDPTDASPAAAAARELREETGYQAARLEPLGVVHPSASRQSTSTHCFLALDCRQVTTPHGDPAESITIHLTPLAEMMPLARRGDLAVASSLCCLLLGLDRLRELGIDS